VVGCVGNTAACCSAVSGTTGNFLSFEDCTLDHGVWQAQFYISSSISSYKLAVLDSTGHERLLEESQYSVCYNYPACHDATHNPVLDSVVYLTYVFESPTAITTFKPILIKANTSDTSLNHVGMLLTISLRAVASSESEIFTNVAFFYKNNFNADSFYILTLLVQQLLTIRTQMSSLRVLDGPITPVYQDITILSTFSQERLGIYAHFSSH
jgi:hypothetical protein